MQGETNTDVQNTLLIAGGISLIAFGAGMLIANPAVRQTLVSSLAPLLPSLKNPLGERAGAILPDIERYLRIKSM
jgi:hypothetical protein